MLFSAAQRISYVLSLLPMRAFPHNYVRLNSIVYYVMIWLRNDEPRSATASEACRFAASCMRDPATPTGSCRRVAMLIVGSCFYYLDLECMWDFACGMLWAVAFCIPRPEFAATALQSSRVHDVLRNLQVGQRSDIFYTCTC